MSTMSRDLAKKIQNEIHVVLQHIAQAHNLKLEKNTASFTDVGLKLSLTFACLTEDGGNARYATEYRETCELYGMRPEWLGQSARMGRDRWELLGIDTRRRKFNTPMKNLRSGEIRLFVAAEVARGFRISELIDGKSPAGIA